MKKFYLSLLLLFSLSTFAGPGDTTWVTAHNKTDLTWYGSYKDTAHFPDGSLSYHKIMLHYTMGCASNGCSDWDYTTRVLLMHATGSMDSSVSKIDTISTSPLQIDTTWNVFEVKIPYELARVITPYGGNLSNNWEHDFVYDLTDFAPLLKDDVEIFVQYQGWSSGFSATLDFAFIEGTPARNVLDVQNVYHGGGSYLIAQDFEDKNLPAQSIILNPATTAASLRANFSGHGFVNALNCAEFCEKDYYVEVGGQRVVTQSIWREDCGLNNIWPQAGTWLYDRANWCPGDKSLFRNHELTSYLTGDTLDLNVDIEAYSYTVPQGESPASYNYALQLFQYGNPNHTDDVELERIIAPSSEDESKRLNPICGNATVIIKNKGSQNLTSCTITYGMNDGTHRVYNWTGNLGFLESEVVQLPFGDQGDWNTYTGSLQFFAVANNPNNTWDQNDLNNLKETMVTAPTVYPAKLKFSLRTNAVGSDTHWRLTDHSGTVIVSGDNLSSNTSYTENLNLAPGCYTFHLEDRSKNGLSFSFNNDGAGSAKFQNDGGNFFFKNFNSNFGTEIKEQFTVGYGIGISESKIEETIMEVYPNPSNGIFYVDVAKDGRYEAQLKVLDLTGKLQYQNSVSANGVYSQELNLSHLPKGVYSLQINLGAEQKTQKIVIH